MSSRKFEIQKKKLAVRRLSQQGAKRSLQSPKGNEKFTIKTSLSPEELNLKKKKLQQRLGPIQGTSPRNYPTQSQPQRRHANRVWVKQNESRPDKQAPITRPIDDLRKKLNSSPRKTNKKLEHPQPQGDEDKKMIQPLFAPASIGNPIATSAPTSSNNPDISQINPSFNPFAAPLKNSQNKLNSATVKSTEQTQKEIFQSPFSAPFGNLNRAEENKDSSSQPKFATASELVKSNPFALALKNKEQPKPQAEKPISLADNSSKSSIFGPSNLVISNVGTNAGLVNPFANALQRSSGGQSAQIVKPDIFKGNQTGKPSDDSSSKTNIFATTSELVKSNPFALALKNKEQPKLQAEKPISLADNSSKSSIFGPSNPVNSNVGSNAGVVNPFANALHRSLGGQVNTSAQSTIAKPRISNENETGKPPEGDASLSSMTSIRLMNVPMQFNEKETFRSFYARFGRIKRVYTHPANGSAIITFFDHEAAAMAKQNGTILQEGDSPIDVFWHIPKPKLAKDGDLSKALEKPDAEKNIRISQVVTEYAKTLKNIQAKDSDQKAEILEKFDQKIREGIKKETDLKKASLVIGTCPDMCPEKERYLREHQRRLAPYEILIGTENADTFSGQFPVIDHTRAIKEYSRSSADQEEPLPHELRPPHVLKMTMDYLMLNIMDSADGNWADWYDFVWNRTRGIRKDITQQHLCDEVSVDLIGKCARFHIICAHHLCEEDINAFDPKINNENLIKCLQSLKHMYDDLFSDKGIICPNEAEFRCYQVLLNLNNTDVLREVMEFRQEVRESREVKFALEVFKSLNSSNYVRFFKLLGAGSYLMACIMQRYFNQIRSKGLLLMNRAYQTGKPKPTPVPLANIARLFAIDEDDEVSEFCVHYGFTVDEGMVYFSKSSYEEPDTTFLPVRSGTIEKKRNCSFGEVVNGDAFSGQMQYNPTISFDDQGIYVGSYHELALTGLKQQEEKEAAEMPPDADNASIAPASRSSMKVERQDVLRVTADFLNEIIAQEVSSVTKDTTEQIEIAVKVGEEIMDNLLSDVISSELRSVVEEETASLSFLQQLVEDVSMDVVAQAIAPDVKEIASECFEEEIKRQNDEKRMLIFHLTTEKTRDFIEETTKDLLREAAVETLREEKGKKFLVILDGATSMAGREIIEKHISEEVVEISFEAIKEEVQRRKERLNKLKEKIVQVRVSRLLKRWIKKFQARKRIRETLSSFPACSALQSSPEVIHSLTKHKTHAANLPEYIVLRNGAEISISSVSSLERKRDRHRDAIELYHKKMSLERHELLKPLDPNPLLNAISNNVKRKTASKRGFSNLLVYCPEISKKHGDQYLDAGVFKSKFKMGNNSLADLDGADIKSLETLTSITSIRNGVISNLCVKALAESFREETEAIRNSHELNGSSGIIFFVDGRNSSEQWKAEADQLHSLLCSKPCTPPLPLLVVAINVPAPAKKESVMKKLDISKLQEQRLCSSFEMISITDPTKFNDQLLRSVISLIRDAPEFPQLTTKSLMKFIEEGLGLYFYESLYDDGLKRREVGIRSQDPHVVIDLYNGVLDHLVNVCCSDRLSNLSWPSKNMMASNKKEYPKLQWNDMNTFKKVSSLLQSLKLPRLSENATPDDCWDDQIPICLEYLGQVTESCPVNVHPSKLVSRIEQVISQYKHKWKYRSLSTFIEFPWDSIIEECTIFILTSFQAQEPRCEVNGNTLISYHEDEYRGFRPARSWIEAVKSLRNASMVSESNISLLAHNLSSKEQFIENSIKETNDDLYKLEQSGYSVHSPVVENDISSLLESLQKKQELLDQSLCSEKLAYSRLDNIVDSNPADLDASLFPEDEYPLIRVKRKRNANRSFTEPKSVSLTSLKRTDSTGSLDIDMKRPKQLFEDKLDDLLKEVEFMRSAVTLDEFRYRDLIDN